MLLSFSSVCCLHLLQTYWFFIYISVNQLSSRRSELLIHYEVLCITQVSRRLHSDGFLLISSFYWWAFYMIVYSFLFSSFSKIKFVPIPDEKQNGIVGQVWTLKPLFLIKKKTVKKVNGHLHIVLIQLILPY